YSILIAELRYHLVSEMCKPMGRFQACPPNQVSPGRPALSNAPSCGRSTQSWATFPPMPKPCSLPVSSAYRWTIFLASPSPTPPTHNTELITMNDVIIIGGSFAGLAGALQLGRARRKVTVLDTGLPRNRFARH